MIEQLLNFEGKNIANVMRTPNDAGSAFATKLGELTAEVIRNYKDYLFVVTKEDSKEFEGAEALHMGKLLAKMLSIAQTDGEKLICIASIETMSTVVMRRVEKDSFFESVKML